MMPFKTLWKTLVRTNYLIIIKASECTKVQSTEQACKLYHTDVVGLKELSRILGAPIINVGSSTGISYTATALRSLRVVVERVRPRKVANKRRVRADAGNDLALRDGVDRRRV